MNSITQQLLSIPGIISQQSTDSVLLTFDDGPNPETTPRVLDLLDQYEARCIFFVVGSRIQKAPHLLSEILNRGHLLGNHTYTHWLDKPPGYKEYLQDLRLCQQTIEQTCGFTPTIFRPALGQINMASLLAARKLHLKYMRWSVDSNDWKLRDAQTALQSGPLVADSISAGDIVLMHDDNCFTPAMLSTLLPVLQEGGIDLHNHANYLNSSVRNNKNCQIPVTCSNR